MYCVAHSSQPQDFPSKSPFQQQGCLFICYIRGVYSSIYCAAHSWQPQDCSLKSPFQHQGWLFIPDIRGVYSSIYCATVPQSPHFKSRGVYSSAISGVSILPHIEWPTLHSPKTAPQGTHFRRGVYLFWIGYSSLHQVYLSILISGVFTNCYINPMSGVWYHICSSLYKLCGPLFTVPRMLFKVPISAFRNTTGPRKAAYR